jgi:hypothetical protein
MWSPGIIFSWLVLALVGVQLALLFKAGKGHSEKAAISVWLVMNIIMLLLTPLIYEICSIYISYSYLIWYSFWVLLNFLSILSIYLLHIRFKLPTSKLASYISLSFLALTLVQACGYLDRAIFETKVLDNAYRFLILSINFAVVPTIFMQLYRDGLLTAKGIFK